MQATHVILEVIYTQAGHTFIERTQLALTPSQAINALMQRCADLSPSKALVSSRWFPVA